MLRVLNNDQLDAEKRRQEAIVSDGGEKKNEDVMLTQLASHVRKCWESAKIAKRDVETQMLKNLRQIKGEYEADKLAAIRSISQPEIFVMTTDTKCRSAQAWIKEILFPPDEKPWDIRPTPIPELPAGVEAEIKQKFLMKALAAAYQEIAMTGATEPLDPQQIAMRLQDAMPDVMKGVKLVLEKKAKEICGEMKKKIDDQLTEGGWHEALDEAIFDIVASLAGIVKGPVFVKEKKRVPVQNPQTGKVTIKIEDVIVPRYSYASPFDIYPAPNSNGIDDLWLIHHIHLTPRELNELIGAPGFDDDEIRAVLDEHRAGGLKEWTAISLDVKLIENKDTSADYIYEKIDALEYWGSVQGKMLLEWGIEPNLIDDPTKDYDICCWLIGRHVIKAMLNPDPLGEKPFSKASFVEKPNSFWGAGLPQVVADLQGVLNAIARALVNNVGMASGPQVERNIDRIPSGQSPVMWPWKVWDVTDAQMGNSAPALNFYQPQMFVEKLVFAYQHFSKLFDEHSGVPGYVQGNTDVSGAGKTASGLGMLMNNAARGIKNVLKTIDSKIITRTVERQYYWNIEQEENAELICDNKIVAKGASSMVAKEQQAVRLSELLASTANPFDMQVLGPDGRRYLLKEAMRAQHIDVTDVFPSELDDLMNSLPGAGNQWALPAPGAPGTAAPGPGMTPAPAAKPLDESGRPVVGQDFRMFNQ